jgi:hypothetical protein
MSRVDLYPNLNSPAATAFVQTGTKDGQKGGADIFVIGGQVGTASAPADYDQGSISYPNAVTEIYTYSKNSTVIKTVTITYTDATKSFISTWVIA